MRALDLRMIRVRPAMTHVGSRGGVGTRIGLDKDLRIGPGRDLRIGREAGLRIGRLLRLRIALRGSRVVLRREGSRIELLLHLRTGLLRLRSKTGPPLLRSRIGL